MRKFLLLLCLSTGTLWAGNSSLTVSSGTFLAIDGQLAANSQFRQSVNVCDPSVTAGCATVDPVTGLKVQISTGSSVSQVGTYTVTPGTGTFVTSPSGTYSVTPGTGTFSTSASQAGTYTVTPGTGTFVTSPTGSYSVTPGTGTFVTSQSGTYTVTPGTGTFPVSGTVSVTGSSVTVYGTSSGSIAPIVICDSQTIISTSSSGDAQIVALSATKVIYVCSFNVMSGGSTNFRLLYGTGSNCATNPNYLTGAYPLIANTGIAAGTGLGPIIRTTASQALCINSSAGVAIAGVVNWTQF